ncbi:MAG: Protein of unknown function (DUF1587)/Protein of unknown function (DUF1592)/Protein of unknown [Verrucomicrobiales bacterium]|nr:Protein of unknown function (DUF1587)/Protein of unknown function (DUF1592)/Protein of unknown [Verrucomicrobiales bacterium]
MFRVVYSVFLVFGLILMSSAAFARPEGPVLQSSKPVSYDKSILPVLREYCFNCHGNGKKKGDLSLDTYRDLDSLLEDRKTWEKVLQNLNAQSMPPENKKQPSPAQRDKLTAWIQTEVFQCDCSKPDPGRVTIRRLNRTEYNNTIHDLVGVDFQPAEDFPQDDTGYGFDNIGDVLSLSPVLLEKYMAAAQKILDTAIMTDFTPRSPTNRFEAIKLDGSAPSGDNGEGMRVLQKEGDVHLVFNFPKDGEYHLRVRAYGEQAGPDVARMAFLLDKKEIKRVEVPEVHDNPKVYQMTIQGTAGKHEFGASYLNNYVNKDNPDKKLRGDRNLVIDYLEIVAPREDHPPEPPETHKRIFVVKAQPGKETEAARQIVARFAKRAWRRSVTKEEVDRLLKFVDLARQNGENFESSVKLTLQAVLVSPYFLFRGEIEPDPNDSKSVHAVNEFALASRLSYFLWSTMPDEELFAEAERGTLRKNLEKQVKRMLKHPKAHALVDNFAGQWLQIRSLSSLTPDKITFPDFNDELRAAMEKETELFFENVMHEDRSILDFLVGDYTFVNERLARHYGMTNVTGTDFQRVSLKGTQRGGVLTHASVLTLTSNPTRTSPVKRGKWILENILGTPPPPPPPNVPDLKEDKQAKLTGSLRQRMEQHRADPNCANCHARMDPIGFGLENFDGIGAWREKDAGFVIDPAGELVSGEEFKGPRELETILLNRKKNEFVRCVSEKMLTYALGRGMEFYDQCAIDQISKALAKNKYRFSTLVMEVVKSTPFQKRRGEETPQTLGDARE